MAECLPTIYESLGSVLAHSKLVVTISVILALGGVGRVVLGCVVSPGLITVYPKLVSNE